MELGIVIFTLGVAKFCHHSLKIVENVFVENVNFREFDKLTYLFT